MAGSKTNCRTKQYCPACNIEFIEIECSEIEFIEIEFTEIEFTEIWQPLAVKSCHIELVEMRQLFTANYPLTYVIQITLPAAA